MLTLQWFPSCKQQKPIKPTKPRRMIFVLAITILVFVGDLTYVLKDYILGKN